MQRSPAKRYDSDPDISKSVTLRKRKHEDDVTETIKSFTERIMSKLDNFKIDFDKNISKINENLNNVIKPELCSLTAASSEMKDEINLLRKDFSETKKSVKELHTKHIDMCKDLVSLQTSVQFNSDQLDDFKSKVSSLSVDSKKIDQHQMELNLLRKENNELKVAINANDQRERLSNLEIAGVPEQGSENLKEIVCTIAAQCNVDISPSDIISVNRVSPRVKQQGRPRVIIAKFASRLHKDNILSGARKHRLTSSDLRLNGDPKPIFINEHLTPYNKQLLKKCKDVAKTKEYQFAWAKNGRIYVRKCDTAPALQILSEEDIRKIV